MDRYSYFEVDVKHDYMGGDNKIKQYDHATLNPCNKLMMFILTILFLQCMYGNYVNTHMHVKQIMYQSKMYLIVIKLYNRLVCDCIFVFLCCTHNSLPLTTIKYTLSV